MDEFNRNKFWIAIGRSGAFSETDNHIFRVWPDHPQYKKNESWDLMPKFVDAKNVEHARREIHYFIDKMFNTYYVPADKTTTVPVTPPVPNSVTDMANMECLTIEPPKKEEKKSGTDGLLNLGDFV